MQAATGYASQPAARHGGKGANMQTSLYGCSSDICGCCATAFCTCIVSANNAASVDSRQCTCCDICSNDYQTRQSLRARFAMEYTPFADLCSQMCCRICFVMQTAKEIALRKGVSPVYLGYTMADRA